MGENFHSDLLLKPTYPQDWTSDLQWPHQHPQQGHLYCIDGLMRLVTNGEETRYGLIAFCVKLPLLKLIGKWFQFLRVNVIRDGHKSEAANLRDIGFRAKGETSNSSYSRDLLVSHAPLPTGRLEGKMESDRLVPCFVNIANCPFGLFISAWLRLEARNLRPPSQYPQDRVRSLLRVGRPEVGWLWLSERPVKQKQDNASGIVAGSDENFGADFELHITVNRLAKLVERDNFTVQHFHVWRGQVC
ncbi:unnamed protein product [Protopolystoma xenopodis]|uniref:Uncharacterized protein n=1 Tax=Protopolystoma xenopodis TaxID=117903 RepID=A0A448WC39_9PLAT|nr:unnamed protein product [Protopolystoma xenopodis]